MAKFKVNDRHIAFVHAIAAGMKEYEAYIEHISPGKKASPGTARANSSGLMKRPEIRQLYDEAVKARNAAITAEVIRNIGPEFSAVALTTDERDNFHYAVMQGLVEVEEVVPQMTMTEVFDKHGKVVQRQRVQNFVRVKRPPNIREKQISADILYKRFGEYAPSRLFAGIGKINDEGELENVQRMIVYSDGSQRPLLP